jgi:hypothetical protein
VLNDVRDAIATLWFIACSGIDPKTHSARVDVRNVITNNTNSIRKGNNGRGRPWHINEVTRSLTITFTPKSAA